MSDTSVLIVDDMYAAAALLPLTCGATAALPDGTPLAWHIVTSNAAAQVWLALQVPSSLAVVVLDIDLAAAGDGALLVPLLRLAPAVRRDACIVMWSSRDDGAHLARTAGADAFLSKQRLGRALAPGNDVLAIVARLWRADMCHTDRPWVARG